MQDTETKTKTNQTKKKIKAQAAARHTLNRGRKKISMREVKCWGIDFTVTLWARPWVNSSFTNFGYPCYGLKWDQMIPSFLASVILWSMKHVQGLNFSIVHCRIAPKVVTHLGADPNTQPVNSQAQPCSWPPFLLYVMLCREPRFIISFSARFWPKIHPTSRGGGHRVLPYHLILIFNCF